MDLNLIRSIVTLAAFGVFVAIVVRVWSAANRERHAEAAALPFADDLSQEQSVASGPERRAAPKPARIPPGDRPTYPLDEGLT